MGQKKLHHGVWTTRDTQRTMKRRSHWRVVPFREKQLKRELDAMGYGRPRSRAQNPEPVSDKKTSTFFANLAISLAAMRLLGAHG